MKEIKHFTQFQSYKDINELTEVDRNLVLLAREALKDAYAPYSKFQVGAAILLDNGQTIKGSNQENAAYPMCLCAERVALSAVASVAPSSIVKTMAITAKSPSVTINQPISPCGACRQVICETEMKQREAIRVILQGEEGEIYIFNSSKDLLPLFFDGTYL